MINNFRPNNEEGFIDETLSTKYTDHLYQLSTDYNISEISSVTEGNTTISPDIYTFEGRNITFQTLENPGATFAINYVGYFSSFKVDIPPAQGRFVPLYSNKNYLPAVKEHNSDALVNVLVSSNSAEFTLYGLTPEMYGSTFDIHFYTINQDSLPTSPFELEELLPNPLPVDSVNQQSTLGRFLLDLRDMNSWNGIASSNSRVYYEEDYSTLKEAMENSLSLSMLPCTVGQVTGSPGLEGTCIAGQIDLLDLISVTYPTNFAATRDNWRPAIFDENGHLTHLSLNFNGQMKYLPKSILNLATSLIQVLNLSNNRYESVDDIVLYDWVDLNDHSKGIQIVEDKLPSDISIIV